MAKKQENAPEEQPDLPVSAPEWVAVRILAACSVGGEDYWPNELVEFRSELLAEINPALYDASREAVEYCIDNGIGCRRHPD